MIVPGRDPVSKLTKNRKEWSIAKVIEHLPCKALRSFDPQYCPPKKLNREIPYNPEIPLLDLYTQKN
jgi:hypothetical protein